MAGAGGRSWVIRGITYHSTTHHHGWSKLPLWCNLRVHAPSPRRRFQNMMDTRPIMEPLREEHLPFHQVHETDIQPDEEFKALGTEHYIQQIKETADKL